VEKSARVSEKRQAVDRVLDAILGKEDWRQAVQEREALGSLAHVFSHIHMTMHVEKLVLQVASRTVLLPSILMYSCKADWCTCANRVDVHLQTVLLCTCNPL
jgi:hypothetical protein